MTPNGQEIGRLFADAESGVVSAQFELAQAYECGQGIAVDTAAQQAFEESIAKTVRPTPAAQQRASRWIERHLSFGKRWANGFVTAEKIKVGGYCFVPGVIDEPRIVLGAPGATVSVWDFGREIGFARDRVVAVLPS